MESNPIDFESARLQFFPDSAIGDIKRVLFPTFELFVLQGSQKSADNPHDLTIDTATARSAVESAKKRARESRYGLIVTIPSPTGRRDSTGCMIQHVVVVGVDRAERKLLVHDPIILNDAPVKKIEFSPPIKRLLSETYPGYEIIESTAPQEMNGENCCTALAAYNLWQIAKNPVSFSADSLPDRAKMIEEWPRLMHALSQGTQLRSLEDAALTSRSII